MKYSYNFLGLICEDVSASTRYYNAFIRPDLSST